MRVRLNKLPDPKSPSVTPAAIAAGAPSVATDHWDVRLKTLLRMNSRPSSRRISIRRLFLGLALLCMPMIGQTSVGNQPQIVDDGARFVGTWELVSVEARWSDGHVTNPWGSHPPGRLVYTEDGRMLVLCMHELRNEAARSEVPSGLQNEAAGYFGTYKVDPQRHTVSHTVAATLRWAESGTIERAYEFQREKLYLLAKATREGLPVTYVLVWKRA